MLEALCYKPEGRGSESQLGNCFFNWPNPSSRTMTVGSTRLITEMSNRNIPGGRGRPERKAQNLTVIPKPIAYKMWKPLRPVTGIALSSR
jgi:hypothetical protein